MGSSVNGRLRGPPIPIPPASTQPFGWSHSKMIFFVWGGIYDPSEATVVCLFLTLHCKLCQRVFGWLDKFVCWIEISDLNPVSLLSTLVMACFFCLLCLRDPDFNKLTLPHWTLTSIYLPLTRALIQVELLVLDVLKQCCRLMCGLSSDSWVTFYWLPFDLVV